MINVGANKVKPLSNNAYISSLTAMLKWFSCNYFFVFLFELMDNAIMSEYHVLRFNNINAEDGSDVVPLEILP